ncbi:hypothetical protein DSCO28_42100 [Desulfosarcina ovata subsp. sediminis]|uniref:Transposase n=1 Tax=Desulfosarcina ovata subsp. sediminis TaxID=885957 RepID=A0A5K7ZTZ0_9BACT|nr:hypothetical protein DSCO28_42100 [Desulfosarcina ovata subsp. sediminis]
MDAKANVNIGPFSRGGYSRNSVNACDHDFKPDTVLKPFGIFFPALDETYLYFTESNITADFIVDTLEDLWPMINARFKPHTIVINMDNGPENNSRRTQFMKRLVAFAVKNEVSLSLVYYPPYHSKYIRCGKSSRPDLWEGRRVTGTSTRNGDGKKPPRVKRPLAGRKIMIISSNIFIVEKQPHRLILLIWQHLNEIINFSWQKNYIISRRY